MPQDASPDTIKRWYLIARSCMSAGDTESDAPPPGFEHVKEGTHSLDNVINRLADAEVGAWMMSSHLPEERCGLEIALHEQPRAWAD